MMDGIALAKAIELQSLAREEQWRRNEDLFYLDYARDPLLFFHWLGRMVARLRLRRAAMKKANRPETGRFACDHDDGSDQAACSRI
ncbi:hypothetical protein GR212_01335 [Rhizobium lusitanum]|uniref:Uncharacterized protein n=1 Tax=Rhizobium lusitanum TaxID=293958 RepID=A0A6L9U177_9HYPH|nr:hypothetical protein [Rhizobium lusitanum]NEI68198.1 hypothetical protein [Rhizobium lusitanum]